MPTRHSVPQQIGWSGEEGFEGLLVGGLDLLVVVVLVDAGAGHQVGVRADVHDPLQGFTVKPSAAATFART